ncbi:hypothetical protein [Streptomyces sp. NRRL B-24484]|uniref:hypothetical protein n=1 Tax=Streptomyces sp. NRRL B-24484 TaxID=1463833 RepID=UPI0004BF21EF|nr:hypothetical protein [Streptomyces sp. NRRL B-24484]
MRLLEDLQNGLESRERLITEATAQSIGREVRYAANWISAQPVLMAILDEARHVEEPPPVDPWLQECERETGIVWPTETEEGRAALIWDLLRTSGDQAADHAGDIFARAGNSNYDHMVRRMAAEAFRPLFVWLIQQLRRRSSVVYTLRRYVYLTERFYRTELDAKFQNRTSTGEELYNDHVQEFMFRDAGYITSAKQRSASGEADLVGELDGEDPIILDGKLFKGDLKYLARGVRQVYEYAVDHGKHIAYLVVFNRTDRILKIDGDGAAQLPYFQIADVQVHVVVIRALPPQTTASKMSTAKVATLTREQVREEINSEEELEAD